MLTTLDYIQIVQIRLAHRLYTDVQYFFFIVIVIWCLDRFESETAAFAASGVKSSVEVIGEICEGER